MTEAIFFRREGRLCGFTVTGHTDNAGSEQAKLVCAAVSSAVYLAANTLTDVIKADASVSVDDGRMTLRLADTGESAAAVLEGLRLHLIQLEEQYPTYLSTKTEVQHDASH